MISPFYDFLRELRVQNVSNRELRGITFGHIESLFIEVADYAAR